MIYKLGDKELFTEHIVAIGEPQYNVAEFFVMVYNAIGSVPCVFVFQDHEEIRNQLRLKDDKTDWSMKGGYYYPQFNGSLIYERIINEVEKLKEAIEKHSKT